MDEDDLKFKRSQISYLTRRERDALQNLDHNASSANNLITMFKARKNVNYILVTYDPEMGMESLMSGKDRDSV